MQTSSPLEENNNESTAAVDENEAKSSVDPRQEEKKETSVSESTAVTAESSSSPSPVMPSSTEASNCNGDAVDDDRLSEWSAIVDRDGELRKQPAANELTPAGGHKCSSPVTAGASPEATPAGVQHCRENAAHASDRGDLDAAVQKLESMRLSDKPPSKRKSNPSKRHSTAKDAAVAAVAAEAECVKSGPPTGGKSKLPSSIASQLTSPSSKIKKRKSRKKSKNEGGAGGGSVPGDEIVHNCKSSPSETTPAAVSNACDARKSFDPCGRTSPSTKSAFRMCLPDNEKLLRSSTENDSLR